MDFTGSTVNPLAVIFLNTIHRPIYSRAIAFHSDNPIAWRSRELNLLYERDKRLQVSAKYLVKFVSGIFSTLPFLRELRAIP